MCPGSPITQISTPVETLTRKAGSFCLSCFSQVMRHLWSLHMSGIPRHTYIHPDRKFYPTSRFILSLLSLHMSGIPHHMDLQSGRNVYQTSWFIQSVFVFDRQWDVTQTSTLVGTSTWPAGSLCLCWFLSRHMDVCGSFCLCCFWLAVGRLWSLHLSRIPCHTDLCPGMNVYLTSWLIQSVLFLTGSETSHGPRPWKECLPDQLVHCVCVVFDRRSDICGPYNCPGTPITPTSTLVGMSTWPAGSFCLCCFWQVVRHLWSLHMSGNPHHMDLHPGRNVYLSSWFILSVLFLTGGETSVVPTCVLDPPLHRSPPE